MLSDDWCRVQAYMPEALFYKLKVSEIWDVEMKDSWNFRRIIQWVVANSKFIDLDEEDGL